MTLQKKIEDKTAYLKWAKYRVSAAKEELAYWERSQADAKDELNHLECLANPNVCHCSAKGACWNHR